MWRSGFRRLRVSWPAFARTRVGPSAHVVVLAYHDLREAADFSSWLRVEVVTFREHLRVLSERGTFIDSSMLHDLGALPDGGPHFLLTFDDGYVNNQRLVLPVLAELGIPALFFISTHNVLTGEPFWFDRIVTPLQAARAERLDLRHLGLREYRFRRRDEAGRWDDIQRLLVDVKRLGNPGEPTVDRVVGQIELEFAGASEPFRERFRPLRANELRAMARSPLCHFGSHGHRHEILTRLPDTDLMESLVRSRRELEGLLGAPVPDFAYPNGDCDDRVARACSEAGYQRGFVTGPDAVSPETDPFRIPRLLVGGYDSAVTLAARVSEVLLGATARRGATNRNRGR